MVYPEIDKVAFHIWKFPVHWYGIMYLAGFLVAFKLLQQRAKYSQYKADWNTEKIADLVFYGALGVIIGGRLGYVLFYDLDRLSSDWLSVFRIWEGGMSFHGGLLGVVIALWLFARRYSFGLFAITDFAVPVTPLGLGLGRLGNFINSELWGRPTDLPWGMVLKCKNLSATDHLRKYCDVNGLTRPLHPSQLYELLLEGVVLFLIVWFFAKKTRPTMAVSGVFLLFYGLFRFLVEFIRLPDDGIYFAFGWLTKGQALSLPMVLAGVLLLWFAYHKRAGSS